MNVGVLLAAGASRRMGRRKAMMRSGSESFLVHGVRHLWQACDAVVVVLGADARRMRPMLEEEFVRLFEGGRLSSDLRQAHRHGAAGLEVRFIENRKWRKGMLGSVRLGLRAALRLGPGTVLVLPVDHPAVKPETVRGLAAAMGAALASYGEAPAKGATTKPAATKGRKGRAATSGFAYALVPRFRRRRGHPIALSPALARAVAADRDASDLSDAVRRNARLVGFLDCADSGVVRNRNRPGD